MTGTTVARHLLLAHLASVLASPAPASTAVGESTTNPSAGKA